MKKFLSVVLFGLFLASSVIAVEATASYSLSPTSQSVSQNQTFTVDVNLSSPDLSVTGTDVVLTYTPSIIKVQSVSFAVIFKDGSGVNAASNEQTIDNTNGKLTLHSSIMQTMYSFKGTAKYATITFTGESTGSSAINFVCTAGTSAGDTNIWSSGSDIVSCPNNIGSTITVTSASTTESTTTETTSSEEISTIDTENTPVAGTTELTLGSFALGIVLFFSGLLVKYYRLKA